MSPKASALSSVRTQARTGQAPLVRKGSTKSSLWTIICLGRLLEALASSVGAFRHGELYAQPRSVQRVR